MLLESGLYGNIGPGQAPRHPGRPTTHQAAQARMWATAFLAGHDTAELRQGLERLAQHPDFDSAGYSKARQARQRLEAELATRPTT